MAMYATQMFSRILQFILAFVFISCTKTKDPNVNNIEPTTVETKTEQTEEYKVFEKLNAQIANMPKDRPSTPESVKLDKIQELIKEGNRFPEFTAPDSKNNTVSDKDFNQGYVLYIFWGTWCSSCIDNIVAVRDAYKEQAFKNVKFVSVSVDAKKESWDQFVYQYDMNDYMTNILIGKNRAHVLSNFLYKSMYSTNDKEELIETYHYVTPSYCLVKDGVIVSNNPMLPKDGDAFLEQLK